MARKSYRVNRQSKRLPLLVGIMLLVVLVPLAIYLARTAAKARAGWWQVQSSGVPWSQRKQLTITNNSGGTISSGTPITITVNTASLYQAGRLLSDCADLRVVYQASTPLELTRAIIIPSGTCATSTNTKVTFQAQASLSAAASSTDYYIYYQNPQATAPTGTNAAFNVTGATATLSCSFDGSTTCVAAGTATAATATGALRYGNAKSAVSFNGVNSYLTAADSAGLSVTGSLTIDAWVYPLQTGVEQTLVAKWDETTANDDRSYRLYITSGNKFAFAVSSNGTSAGTTTITGATTTVAKSTWYHVAGVYNPTGITLDLYVNGVSDATQVTNGPASIDDNASALYLGTKKNTAGTLDTYFLGYLDEVRVSSLVRYTGTFSTSTAPNLRDNYTNALYHLDGTGDDPRSSGNAFDDACFGGTCNPLTISSASYVSGLIGIDNGTSDTGNAGTQSYAAHPGIMTEEATTNKIVNPSFEDGALGNWNAITNTPLSPVVVASAGTVIHSAGRPPQSHLFYAENSGRWWLLYWDSTNTNQLKSKYSSDFTTWTAGATLTLARNHNSDAANFAVAYKNISGNDVVHVAITYVPSNTSHYQYHVRGTISGTTLSWGTEAQVGQQNTNSTAATTNSDGPITAYDSNNKVWVATGFVKENLGDGTWIGDNTLLRSSNADLGSSWTAGFDVPIASRGASGSQVMSRYLGSLGSGNMMFITDNNAIIGGYTNLDTYTYTGSLQVTPTPAFSPDINQMATTAWDAVAVSATDIHAVSFTNTNAAGNATHRRWNGTSWGAGAAITNYGSTIKDGGAQNGENLFLATNNTDVWMFALSSDNHSIPYNIWTAAGNSWGGWTDTWQTNNVARHNISGYPAVVNNTIGVLWSQDNGANQDLVVKPFDIITNTVSDNTTAPYVKFGSHSAKITTYLGATSMFTATINSGNTNNNTLTAYLYRGTAGNTGGTISNTVAQLVFKGTAQSTTAYTDMGGGWWRLSYTGTGTADNQSYGIYVVGNEVIYVDGVQLEEKAYATTYADGNLGTNYAWTGATNGSTSTRTVTNLQYATASNLTAAQGSISFWAKPQLGVATVAGNQYLFDMRQAATNRLSVFMKAADDDMAIDTNDTQTSSTGITMSGGAWEHFVFTWDFTADQYKLYQNGNTTPIVSTTTSLNAPTLATNFYLGSDYLNANSFNGTISDFRIYNAILTTTNVTDLYYSGLTAHAEGYAVDKFIDAKGQNPVAIWHMDEGGGSTAGDSSQYANPLTLSNTAWATGSATLSNRNQYVSFNGTVSKASRTFDTDFDFGTGDFSIGGWFRHPTTISATQVILSRYSTAGYKVYLDASGHLCFGIDDDSSWGPDDSACSAGTYLDSTWHHFEAVKSGTTSITLYVDGAFVMAKTSLTATGSLNNNTTLYLGTDSNGTSNWWNGSLDDVVIYPYARSAVQVQGDVLGAQTTALMGSQAGDPLSQSLVGYWKLDESSSGAGAVSRLDASGNGNTFTDTNTTPSTSGKFGSAATVTYANGEQLAITDANQKGLDITGPLTMCAWINHTTNANLNTILSKYLIAGNQRSFTLFTYGTKQVYFRVSQNGTAETETSTGINSFTDGVWNHICGVYTGSQLQIFINGTQYFGANTPVAHSAGIYNSTASFGISDPHNSDYFSGAIDEARVYNRALSPAEITQLYTYAPGPVGYWKMDEISGTTAADSSGNGFNGTLTNGPVWTIGKYANALSFDGGSSVHDDFVNIQSPATLDNLHYNAFSFGAWAKVGSITGFFASKTDNGAGHGWYGQFNGDIIQVQIPCSITGADSYTSTTNFSLNTWHYLAFSYDNNATSRVIKIFVDGKEAPYDTQTPCNGNAVSDASDNLSLGGWSDINASSMDGLLDDVKLYNYARTGKQIIEDMNAGHPAPGSPVSSSVANWHFDEGGGTTVHDASGNSKDLTLSAASWTTAGKYSTAWHGTGTQWAYRTDDANLDFAAADDFTLSAWAKHATQAPTSTSLQYAFNAYDSVTEKWTTTPERMVDGVLANYAATATDTQVEKVTGNAYDATPSGTINKVSLRIYARNVGAGSTGTATIRPVFNGTTDGDNHVVALTTTIGWKPYIEITNDTNHPAWTWADIGNLDVDVVANMGTSTSIRVSEVEVMVDFTPTTTPTEYFLTKYDGTNGGYKTYLKNHKYCFGIDDDSSWGPDDEICSSTSFDDNLWHNVQAVKTGTSRIDLYVDGNPQGSKSPISATNTLANGGSLYIGDQDGADNGSEFIGDVDEVKIYRSALTADQAKLSFNQGMSQTLGALSSESSADTGDQNATARGFCVPGDTSTCTAPLGWWKLDDKISGDGQSIVDSSGNNYGGTTDNGTNGVGVDCTVTGKLGNACQFDGIDDTVTVGTENNLNPTSAITISTWIKATANTDYTYILSRNYGLSPWDSYVLAFRNSDLEFSLALTGGTVTSAATPPSVGAWHYLAGTYDGSRVKLYVDGILADNQAGSGTIKYDASPAPWNLTRLGSDYDNYFFNGKIDDVKIYDYARTPAQIAWDYNHGAPIAWYKFDECSGATAYNAAPAASGGAAGMDGTINAGTSGGNNDSVGSCSDGLSGTTNSMRNAGTTGKYGASLNFDGTNDLITVTDNANLRPGNDSWSVSLWAKPPNSNQLVPIISKDKPTSNYSQWSMYICGDVYCTSTNGKKLVAFFDDETGYRNSATVVDVADGNWHHLVMVADKNADTIRLFVDGVEKSTTQNNALSWPTVSNTNNLIIGASNYGQYFSGSIDDVRVFNYALTSTQISTLYNGGAAVKFGP